jgi:hypothetical protein
MLYWSKRAREYYHEIQADTMAFGAPGLIAQFERD